MILLTSYINKHSNKILILLFSVFFLVGILSFKDYGISIDEEFQRFSGFYWLNYVVQFMPFENLKEIVSNKFNDINGTVPKVGSLMILMGLHYIIQKTFHIME